MSFLGSITSVQNPLLAKLPGISRDDAPEGPVKLPGVSAPTESGSVQPGGFGQVFGQLVSAVDGKQKEAQAITRDVLLGNSDNLHQSMIAMQEAGVAFQLMVEVRNKVVESYQELMRMPV
jgi:flagellar hook-basal body complex protein FliE